MMESFAVYVLIFAGAMLVSTGTPLLWRLSTNRRTNRLFFPHLNKALENRDLQEARIVIAKFSTSPLAKIAGAAVEGLDTLSLPGHAELKAQRVERFMAQEAELEFLKAKMGLGIVESLAPVCAVLGAISGTQSGNMLGSILTVLAVLVMASAKRGVESAEAELRFGISELAAWFDVYLLATTAAEYNEIPSTTA